MQISKAFTPWGRSQAGVIDKNSFVSSQNQTCQGSTPALKTSTFLSGGSSVKFDGEICLPFTPNATSGKSTWSPYSRMGDSGLKMMAASSYSRHQMASSAANPPMGANFLHMPRTVIFPPMKISSKITMVQGSKVDKIEIDVENIASAVVHHLSSESPYPEESSYEDIEEVLRLYLIGKRLLTKAFDNKTKRQEILLKIDDLLQNDQNEKESAEKNKKTLQSEKPMYVVNTDPDDGSDIDLQDIELQDFQAKTKSQEGQNELVSLVKGRPERIIALAGLQTRCFGYLIYKGFQLDGGIMKHFNNEEFRQSFEKVGIQSISAELDYFNNFNPSYQIWALHLLHTMGLLSASLGLNVSGDSVTQDYINSCLDKGLTTAYVVNELSRDDWDQSKYYNEHRGQCVTSCLLSAFSREELVKTLADDSMFEYVNDTRIKSEIVTDVASYQTPSAEGLKFIDEKYCNDGDRYVSMMFNISLAIAKEYASNVPELKKIEDFEIDYSQLNQERERSREDVFQRVIEQIEKKR